MRPLRRHSVRQRGKNALKPLETSRSLHMAYRLSVTVEVIKCHLIAAHWLIDTSVERTSWQRRHGTFLSSAVFGKVLGAKSCRIRGFALLAAGLQALFSGKSQ